MSIKQQREAALKAASEIVEAAKAAGRTSLTDAEKSHIEAHLKAVDGFDALLKEAEQDRDMLTRMNALFGPQKSGGEPEIPGVGGPAEQLTCALAMKSPIGVNFRMKADLTSSSVTGEGLQPGVNPVPMERPASPLALADLSGLLGVQTVDNPEQVYYQVSNVTGIDVVAEGALKPELTHNVEGKTLKLEKLAGWFRTTTEMQTDAKEIVQAILRQAYADLTSRENKLVIDAFNGAEGVAVTSGAKADVLDLLADAVGEYVARNGGAPEYLVASPTDLAAMRKIRAAGSGEYLIDPFSNPTAGPMGLAVKAVPGMASGTMFVGASLAGTFFRHSGGVQLVNGYQGDDIIRNKVTTVIEERVAAAVTMPQYLSKVTLNG